MVRRCHSSRDKDYANYGGRGIRVCERWRIFENFFEDMGERPSDEHSIDRIDNAKGYEPGNVRWATTAEQLRNYSRNVVITLGDKSACLEDWATELGISPMTLKWRLKHHPVEVALTPGRHLRGGLRHVG